MVWPDPQAVVDQNLEGLREGESGREGKKVKKEKKNPKKGGANLENG